MKSTETTMPPKAFIDALLRLRPGALKTNVSLLTELAKASAKAGHDAIYLPSDAVRGGDCGSLNRHPAFLTALEKANANFEKALERIKGVPRLRFIDGETRRAHEKRPQSHVMPLNGESSCSIVPYLPIADEGPDPCLPFCGHPQDVFCRQKIALARRLAAIGCRNAVIGLSGGLDSALALLAVCGAFEMLGLPQGGIHVYTMPGFGTSKRTRGNAGLLAEGLGLKLETIDITPACTRHFKDIRQPPGLHDVTFENAQARERTQILMDKANQMDGIVVGTGDMSEIALGWCTYNGDHMSMFGVNAGVPKTTVRDVCRWWASNHPGTAANAILDIIATPVSPELIPSANGGIAQRTEDSIGPYELHDFFLWHFAGLMESRRQTLSAAKKAFKGRHDAATIEKWLGVFLRRLHRQSFKRNCAPDGARIFSLYFSPDAWHIPSDISDEWLSL